MAKKKIGFGDFYCVFCGEGVEKKTEICPRCGRPYNSTNKFGSVPALGAGGVGWSDQTDNPCFKKNNKRNIFGMIIIMMIISVIIFSVIYFTSDMEFDEVLPIFGGVMAIEWIFWIIWLIGQYGKRKDWEGVVERKEHYQREVTRKDNQGYRYTETELIYKVHFRKNSGKKKTLTSIDRSEWYDYLFEGDRIRYHGKNMNYYEKYDKSHDTMIPCASCGSARDARETYCGRCGAILLKGQPMTYTPPIQAQTYTPQPNQANFCPNCGAKSNGGAFCTECGTKL